MLTKGPGNYVKATGKIPYTIWRLVNVQFTNVIYQIGRLDKYIKNVTFKIKDYKKESELSSLAFKKYLVEQKKETSAVILLYPVSLPLNESLKDKDHLAKFDKNPVFKNAIIQAIEQPHSYLKNPARFFNIMPYYADLDDYLILHSLGTYMKKNTVSFQTSFDDVVLEIFLDILVRYLQQGFRRLYLDISSGLNIYVPALLEAGRIFGTWSQLRYWQNKADAPEVHLLYTDPILANVEVPFYNIYEQKVEYKTFFFSPITSRDSQPPFCRKLLNDIYDHTADNQSCLEKRERLACQLEQFVYFFSALKNNIPLILYHLEGHSLEQITTCLKDLIDDTRQMLQDNYQKSPKLSRTSYTKAILSLGFYQGIVEVLQAQGITKAQEIKIPLLSVEQDFEQVYNKFMLSLNRTLLTNEIGKIKSKIESKKDQLETGKWYSVSILEQGTSYLNAKNKRNFLAHSGLEKNITQFIIEQDNIYLRYADQYQDRQGNKRETIPLIKKWLKEDV